MLYSLQSADNVRQVGSVKVGLELGEERTNTEQYLSTVYAGLKKYVLVNWQHQNKRVVSNPD